MGFAARADLLARCNARRLAQLAVPADMDMVPDEALRLAIAGGDLSGYSQDEQQAIALALDAIDKALADADALVLTYGIPDTVQTPLLARIASTIALYNLQGAENMTEDVSKAYGNVITMLGNHSKGTQNLIPAPPEEPAPSSDLAIIDSRPGRYGVRRLSQDDDD